MATGGYSAWDVTQNAELDRVAPGERVEVAGLVLIRQRPGTAKGVVFMTLEDETGVCNVIVWPHVLEKYRPVVMGARLVHVTGELQREGIVTHIVAARLIDLSGLLDELADPDAHREGIATLPPFANTVARADEVARQSRDPREAKRDPRRDRLLTQMYPSRDFH